LSLFRLLDGQVLVFVEEMRLVNTFSLLVALLNGLFSRLLRLHRVLLVEIALRGLVDYTPVVPVV
jgi:uncharacterized membrane protein YcjF (UPF0283 family)